MMSTHSILAFGAIYDNLLSVDISVEEVSQCIENCAFRVNDEFPQASMSDNVVRLTRNYRHYIKKKCNLPSCYAEPHVEEKLNEDAELVLTSPSRKNCENMALGTTMFAVSCFVTMIKQRVSKKDGWNVKTVKYRGRDAVFFFHEESSVNLDTDENPYSPLGIKVVDPTSSFEKYTKQFGSSFSVGTHKVKMSLVESG